MLTEGSDVWTDLSTNKPLNALCTEAKLLYVEHHFPPPSWPKSVSVGFFLLDGSVSWRGLQVWPNVVCEFKVQKGAGQSQALLPTFSRVDWAPK